MLQHYLIYCCNYLRKITKIEMNSQQQQIEVISQMRCNYLRKITKIEKELTTSYWRIGTS